MKLKVHMNVGVICAECTSIMFPMVEYNPRRIVYCANDRCSKFQIAVEILPIEVDAVEASDILVDNAPQ
jgi:hypothetical protein